MKPAASIWTDPRSQRWFTILLALYFVGVSVQYTFKVSTPNRDGMTASAVLRWMSQIQMLADGKDVHRSHNYPNPPIMAMILWPFSELAVTHNLPVTAALIWFFLKVAMAFCCFWWTFRLIETPERPFPVWGKILAVGLSIRPITGDLSHGNVNLFILFAVLASLYAFSRGYDLLSGILLALSIACKVTPALFVGYFLWKRAWRVLVGCGVGLFLWFLPVPAMWLGLVQNWDPFQDRLVWGIGPSLLAGGVIWRTFGLSYLWMWLGLSALAFAGPAIALGWAQNWQALVSWVEVMILPFVLGGFVTPEHNNQSLPGLIARLLTEAPSFSTYIGDLYVPIQYHNLTDIGAGGAKWLVRGFMGLFVLLVIGWCRTPIRSGDRSEKRQGWQLAAEYSIVLIGMLLFSERTWKHHCVTLLLPFAVLCYGIAAFPSGGIRRQVLIASVSLATLAMSLTSTGLFAEQSPKLHEIVEQSPFLAGAAPVFAMTHAGELTDSIAKTAQVYGAYTFAFVVLLAGLAVMLARGRAVKPLECTSA
jgi:alpha-1,2-mannosyltransferase